MSRIRPAPNQAQNRADFEREQREGNSDRVLVWVIAIPCLIVWAFILAVTR